MKTVQTLNKLVLKEQPDQGQHYLPFLLHLLDALLQCKTYCSMFRVISVQSALVISNSKGLSEIHQDTRTLTYQICRIEKNLTTECPIFICNLTPLHKIYIYLNYCGKGEKLLLKSNFSSYPQYFLPVVKFLC